MDKIKDTYRKADYYIAGETGSNSLQCFLCPRKCIIKDGAKGFCGVRYNSAGVLFSLVYGYPSAIQVDPVEKKPFAEYLRGTKTFSIGTYGCNLNCLFCQNYHLSRGTVDVAKNLKNNFIAPDAVVNSAIEHGCRSVAFTYNEPTVWAEYAIDIAKLAHKNGLEVLLVSNGYISEVAARELYPYIDAANIDMKGFSEAFYDELTGGHLENVLDSIAYLYKLEKHIELTNLIIPGKNDSENMINSYLDWVESNLDKSVPLHFSAYHPMYKFKSVPRTPAKTLFKIREAAENRKFTSIYLGNI